MSNFSEVRYAGLDDGDRRYGLHPMARYPATANRPPYRRNYEEALDQDVAIKHLDGEQAGWSDAQLLGRVIEVSDAADGHIHRRTMVVLAVSDIKFLQCVLVCRHPEIGTHGQEFHKAHIPVVESRQHRHGWQEPRSSPPPARVVTVAIEDRSKYALRDGCYINLQHAWTVRNEVMFRNIGTVEDFQELRTNFKEVQSRMYENPSEST